MIATAVLFAAAAAVTVPVEDHGYGPVAPVPVPNVAVTLHDGRTVRLPELMRGRRTAVQFVFMDCKTACPLLGSLFHNVDRRLGQADNTALISISVNPERDTPARLATWLQGFEASPRWSAVRADAAALHAIRQAFGQKEGPPSGHSMQVFFVDREATYVARTLMLPQAARVANALLGKVEMAGRASESTEDEDTAALASVPTNREPDGGLLYSGGQPLAARLGGEPLAPQAATCANCHGAGRAGAAEGRVAPSSLRARSLLNAQPRRGGPASRYTDTTFCQSLRSGLDPAGVMFNSAMPRYDVSDGECRALWNFLTAHQ